MAIKCLGSRQAERSTPGQRGSGLQAELRRGSDAGLLAGQARIARLGGLKPAAFQAGTGHGGPLAITDKSSPGTSDIASVSFAPVVRSANEVTNEIDAFVRQAGRKPQP